MFTNVKVVVIQMENIVAIKLKRWCGGGGERREGGGGVLQQGPFRFGQVSLGLSGDKWDLDYCLIFTGYSRCKSRL